MKRPVFASIFVQRLLRPLNTCVRLFTVPERPFPFGPFFAMPPLYRGERCAEPRYPLSTGTREHLLGRFVRHFYCTWNERVLLVPLGLVT